MTTVPTDPLIGQTLDDRYVVRSRIARGGMAMVYLANDLRLERRVAVKVMHEHLAHDANFTRRFEQEARSAARLAHPNLVNVFDQGQDLGRTYLVMEYLPSITLRDLLKQQKRLTTDQALEIGEAILAGLSAAHAESIVHRDLKPENVMLADDGRIKLGDFGLARAVSANTTTGQALLGTIAYLSPELVTRGIADERSDLYAFGIMMYEMLTGVQPYTGEQPMQIAYQHAHSDVPVPSLVSDQSTPGLDALVRWTTNREPSERPKDASEALAHITALRTGGSLPAGATRVLETLAQPQIPADETTVLTSASVPAQPRQQPARETRTAEQPQQRQATSLDRVAGAAHRRARRGKVLALIAVIAIALAGGIGWWFGQGPGSRITVPDIAGTEVAAAQAQLEAESFVVTVVDCSSLDVPVGNAVSTAPDAGARLDRGSKVELCRSTGPQQLDVPTLVGLSTDEAKDQIKSAGFAFGDIVDTRFADSEAGTVLAALGENGDALAETYPEQAPIDLIVSAGLVPSVDGLTSDDAVAALKDAGLVVDPALGAEVHSDTVAKGSVIALTLHTDPVRPGDAVGLTVSLGPELFEIPAVAGMPLQEAMDALAAAGFSPSTRVPDPLREFAKATGTDPGEGEKVPLGAEIRVLSTLSL